MHVLKRLIIWLLVLLILGGAAWYFLVYNPFPAAHFFAQWGKRAVQEGNTDWALQCYNWSLKLDEKNQDVSMALTGVYKGLGNYTKAEYTLVNAISNGGDSQVYLELCRTYVEQDKLLDAVSLLDHIADPNVASELNAQRPAAPTITTEEGEYNHYMDVALIGQGGTMYYATGEEYPSTGNVYETPISLVLGENTVSALIVGENGLVSPLSRFYYTIGGVVESVTLQDKALDSHVRELLGRGNTYQLTTVDLWNIDELTLPGEVTDLSQLGYFTGLTSLTILDRPGLDISFLAQMPKLSSLNLSGCTLDPEQLHYIGELACLERLSISGCNLSTLAGLRGTTKLTYVDASVNSISDLIPLMGNAGLKELYLQHNAITGFDALAHMKDLTILNLSNNTLQSFAPIATCLSLQEVDVSSNALATLVDIGNLTSLKKLNASHNGMTSCQDITGCTSLTELNLSNNALTAMDELALLPALSVLDVSYNDIVVVADFPDDAPLSVFNGCHNFFVDVLGLGNLNMLNYVYLDYNNISDISILATCRNLIQVNVFKTNVSDVTALEGMDIIISYNPT